MTKEQYLQKLSAILTNVEAVVAELPGDSDNDHVVELTTAVVNAKAELVDALYSLQFISEVK